MPPPVLFSTKVPKALAPLARIGSCNSLCRALELGAEKETVELLNDIRKKFNK